MGSHGIKDRVAIIGMGCTPFGERWDKSTDDLLIDSTQEAFNSVGVEKLKDSGFSGLTGTAPPHDGTSVAMTAPAMFSLLAPAYREKFGVSEEEMKDVLTRIAWKNHYNGARNPRAQFRAEVPKEVICASPLIAGQLGIFDCSGVSDGSAAAIIVRAEDASKYTDKPLFVKALSFAAGPAAGPIDPAYDYTTFTEVVRSAA